jgi:glycosyltransferase involved in cell wall biosynthesis
MTAPAFVWPPSSARAQSPALNIVFLLGGLGVGGAERQAIAVAGALQRMGQRVTLIAIDDGPMRSMVEEHRLPLRVLGRVAGVSPGALPKLRRELRDIEPDIVYAFLEVQWLLALAATTPSRSRRPQVVLGLRAGEYVRPTALRSRIVYELSRHAVTRADMLIANSGSGLLDMTAGLSRRASGVVIPNGIDTTTFEIDKQAGIRVRAEWGVAADAFVVGHVGRLHPVKNHAMLIDAFATFAKRRDAMLICVGDGAAETRESLLQRAANNGVADRVRFVGPRQDLRAVYNAFDILALSSNIEGFPNVVAESLACGTPAVVTDVGACAEIVGTCGEVAPRGDVDEFARGLEQLASRTSQFLSAACRARIVDHFTMDRCAERTLAAFNTLLQSRNNA